MTTTPPDHDLRPSIRARQHDELVAIVNHDLTRTPRRKLTPFLAAASVLAVTGGLAIGIPAVRNGETQVVGPDQTDRKPATRALAAKEQPVYTSRCLLRYKYIDKKQVRSADGFRWSDPPADASADVWVIVRTVFGTTVCGFKDKTSSEHLVWLAPERARPAAIVDASGGVGTYAKNVARVTITHGSGRPVDGVLKDGFFFAPVPLDPDPGMREPEAPLGYTARAYDAAGKVLYQSPRTVGDHRKELSCRTQPGRQPKPGDCDGKFFVKPVARATEQ